MKFYFNGYSYGTPKSVFMMWFFAGAYTNFLCPLTALNAKYGDRRFTKAKWLGSLAGFALSSIIILLIFLFNGVLGLEPLGGIILVVYLLSIIIFHIIYKKVIEPRNGDYYFETGTWDTRRKR